MRMGGDTLASFFLKIQAVEESFLLLEVKERSRALNILQSSVNKLLNFVGDADLVSASLSASVPDSFLSTKDQKSQQNPPTSSQESSLGCVPGKNVTHGVQKKRKSAIRCKNNKDKKSLSALIKGDQALSKGSFSVSVTSATSKSQNVGGSCTKPTHSMHQSATETPKHETKDHFDDDLQELADFDYDFHPNLQHTSTHTMPRGGAGHMVQCGGKFTGKLLSMSTSSDRNICPTSGAQSGYPEQALDVSASCDSGNSEVSHSHYGGQLLSGAASKLKATCRLAQPPQYGAQIMACPPMDSSESSQFAGGVIDSNGDPSHSQYAGGVMDSSGNPSQYAGGVIDSSGDPSQYAGGVIESSGEASQYAGARGAIDSSGEASQYAGGAIDSSGEASQYAGTGGVIDASEDPSQYTGAVIDSSGDTTQYAGGVIASTSDTSHSHSQYAGGVIDMSDGQEAPMCDPSQMHTQYSGAMIPTAQDVTVCTTTTQYPGTVLAMTVPDSISYSAAPCSHAIMQGLHCGTTHAQFAGAVLDMSASAGRHGEIAVTAAQPSAPYSGTIFEGTVLGSQASSPFQFRRPMFEPHEAFHRSQELTLMHASMLQQQQLYQLHQQTVTSRWRVFVCRACGVSLTHHRSVKAHLLTHGASPLCCRYCRQVQVNAVALLHHLCGGQNWKQSASISREMHMCHDCGKFFTSRSRLRGHCEREHHTEVPADTKYTCRFCGLQLSKKGSMVCHYRQHAGGRLVCRLCGAILNDFVQYASHLAAHDKRRKKRTCQHCGEVFPCRQKLAGHVETHVFYACDRCHKTWPSQAALARHLSKAHSDRGESKLTRSSKGHQCGICHKLFPRAKDLDMHSRLHAAGKTLDCLSCKMRFRSRRALGKHRRTLGHCQRTGKTREAQHLCSECGKAYFRRQALHRHLRQHQSSKPFSCKYCNFRCGAKDNLRRHESQHFSTERNFICELCGAAFHAKKTLEMHHNYKHSSERHFKCSECPMTFKARNALNRHAKTHSCSRDHGCWCGAAFNRLYNLRRHMRLVHGSDDALPPLRKVEVLDSNQTVKQAVSTPPAKKMLLKSRKVKADCMQEEQEAAAAAVVMVGGGGGEGEEEEGRGGRGGGGDGVVEKTEREALSQAEGGMTPLVGSGALQLSLPSVGGGGGGGAYSPAMSGVAGGGVVGPAGVIHPFSHTHPHPHAHPHPHLTMEQSYAMVSATLHHHHHHHHNLHHHDPQPALLDPATAPLTPHPFPHLSHPSLDYSQLSTMVPYSTGNAATTAVGDAAAQRQDYFPASGAGGLEGMQQSTTTASTADYTTSPFSFIQNFLLPPVGVANLLDLTHASGAK